VGASRVAQFIVEIGQSRDPPLRNPAGALPAVLNSLSAFCRSCFRRYRRPRSRWSSMLCRVAGRMICSYWPRSPVSRHALRAAARLHVAERSAGRSSRGRRRASRLLGFFLMMSCALDDGRPRNAPPSWHTAQPKPRGQVRGGWIRIDRGAVFLNGFIGQLAAARKWPLVPHTYGRGRSGNMAAGAVRRACLGGGLRASSRRGIGGASGLGLGQ